LSAPITAGDDLDQTPAWLIGCIMPAMTAD
jgi:hypothetical protein